jgi:hypothetical protein
VVAIPVSCTSSVGTAAHASVRSGYQSAILTAVKDDQERPFGSIFRFEGHDLAVEPDVEAMERYIEPYDADEGENYDERGHRLKARVIGENWPKRVELSVIDGEPQPSVFIARVGAFMDRVGVPRPSADDPSVWMREAAATVIAWQRWQTPWGRLRHRLRRSR